MAFTAINSDQKQSINLSEDARIVVRQDMASFGCKKYSGFFNRVILNYYADADATLSRARQRIFEAFCNDLTELPEDPKAQRAFRANLKKLPMAQREHAAEILADNTVQKLKEQVIDRYPRGSGIKFRINNELFQYLTESSECQEDGAYCDSIGRYLKAILEEYARLPYHRREKIYYAQWFTDIENAIEAQKRLAVTVLNGAEYSVKPCQILTDSQSTYHYLVAWNPKTKEVWPFRISNIQKLRQLRDSGKISENEKLTVEAALRQKDVPFLGEPVQVVRVQLTEAGIHKYNTLLHMRPRYEEKDENIFTFHAPLRQVQYYFEKFGPDAKILEPAELAQKMQQWHQQAALQYER